jgi:hypothetical protein
MGHPARDGWRWGQAAAGCCAIGYVLVYLHWQWWALYIILGAIICFLAFRAVDKPVDLVMDWWEKRRGSDGR